MSRTNNSKTGAKTLAAQQRDMDALRMRIEDPDVSWQTIADTFGYASRGAACSQVMKHHRAAQKETSDEFREFWDAKFSVALDEVNTIIDGTYPIPEFLEEDDSIAAIVEAVKKDGKLKLEAIDRLVKVNDQLAKMHGFLAPTKIEATGPAFNVFVDPDMLPDGATVTNGDS